MSLFEDTQPPKPLAERMRPTSLDQVLGQTEARGLLEAYIDQGEMPSIVFFGPPGTGKTSLSRLMASLLGYQGHTLNATSASVKDIRELAVEAKDIWRNLEKRTLLFIDEIHRLNKAQQDVLLPIVESGTLVLAGSTTENPFFALNQALQSRVQLVRLQPLDPEDIAKGLKLAEAAEKIQMEDQARDWLSQRVAGDLRLAYTTLESAAILAASQERAVSLADTTLCLKQTRIAGDRAGDNHYDLASAFQKSLRGSDPDAAIYYLARFLEGGEDPRFIARRLLITASEDVGNADPLAFQVASNAFRAVETLGMPEAGICLSQAVLYVARAPKSNEAVAALGAARKYLKTHELAPIPEHLRDTHYKGAAKLGHGKGYVYTHNDPEQGQFFLPDKARGEVFTQAKPAEQARRSDGDEELQVKLHQHLKQVKEEGEWFELEAESIAEQIQAPLQQVRTALNKLVQTKRLTFQRRFKLAD